MVLTAFKIDYSFTQCHYRCQLEINESSYILQLTGITNTQQDIFAQEKVTA